MSAAKAQSASEPAGSAKDGDPQSRALSGDVAPGAGRQVWLDYAKAIGITLVVLGHANQGLAGPDMTAWNAYQVLINSLIYSFHMPLFFVLAGYAAALAPSDNAARFVRGLFWGVVLPYLVWSTIWIGVKAALPEATTNPAGLTDLTRILWAPVEHLWFLYALFFARIVWQLVPRDRLMPVAASVIPVLLVAALTLRLMWPAALTVPYFLENLAFYGMGLALLAPSLTRLTDRHHLSFIMLASGAVWLAIVLASPPIFDARVVAIVALAGSPMVIACARVLPQPKARALQWIATVGEASLVIYVLHLFFTAATRWVLVSNPAIGEPLLLLLSTFAGLLGPLAVYVATSRLGAKYDVPLMRWFALGQHRGCHYLDIGRNTGGSTPVAKPINTLT